MSTAARMFSTELAAKHDPRGKFRNDFLNTYIFAR
jgi:hypothetical protein